jgi:hypothetical protein
VGIWEIEMNFIQKLEYTANLDQMKADLDTLLAKTPWPAEDFVSKSSGNQIGITYRIGAENIILDASGSLYDKEKRLFVAKESDFTEINPDVGQYTKNILAILAEQEHTKFGRIRYMRLMPKTGLSIHADFEMRYHYVLDTNGYALFGDASPDAELAAKCYHIPADGHFYKVDTTREHFVFNGGWEPRIHLVLCEAK